MADGFLEQIPKIVTVSFSSSSASPSVVKEDDYEEEDEDERRRKSFWQVLYLHHTGRGASVT
jgi:hypothetical protein